MRNVLLIARNFAPVSHVSAERATKLAKYLPRFGWHPTVLTGARPTAGLAEDLALLDQVAGVPIIRTRAPEFSAFYASRSRGKGAESSYRGAPKRAPPSSGGWRGGGSAERTTGLGWGPAGWATGPSEPSGLPVREP